MAHREELREDAASAASRRSASDQSANNIGVEAQSALCCEKLSKSSIRLAYKQHKLNCTITALTSCRRCPLSLDLTTRCPSRQRKGRSALKTSSPSTLEQTTTTTMHLSPRHSPEAVGQSSRATTTIQMHRERATSARQTTEKTMGAAKRSVKWLARVTRHGPPR